MIKVIKPLLLLFVCTTQTLSAQINTDSLIRVFPTQPNEEKAKTLSDLCFYLSFSDLDASVMYGKMSYEAALETGNENLISRTLSDWSIPYLTIGNFDSVIILNQRVLEIEIPEGDSLQVGASLNKMGLAEYKRGNNDVALNYNLRALAIFQSEGADAYAGQTLACIGNIYDSNKMFELALDYYRKAKAVAKDVNDEIGYTTALSNEGHALQNLKRYKDAEVKLREANQLIQSEQNPKKLGLSYQTLGLNARLDNRPTEGRQFYQKALNIFSDLNYAEGLCTINMNISECFLTEKNSDSAEVYMNRSLQIAEETGSFSQLQIVYKSMVRLENLKGDYEAADSFFDLYVSLTDSIYNEETNNSIADMQVKYETDQKELALEQEKLNKKNAQLWLVVATTAVGLLLFLVMFIRHRKKISEQKLELKSLQNIESERGRIARDLHDNLGADLTLITSKVDVQAFQQKDPNFKADLEKISDISKSANAQLRDTIWSIHKSSLDLGELSSKISDFAHRIFDDKNIGIDIVCKDKKINLPPAKALNLYRIAQEFMTNSMKYASAQNVTVKLSENSMHLKDDGNGFDFKTVKKGYGLNNISERVEELKSKSTWSSSSIGTELNIQF